SATVHSFSGQLGDGCNRRFRLLLAESYRDHLRHSRLLHGDSVENGRRADGAFVVSNHDELGAVAHLFYQIGKASDVGFIEWRIYLVEYAERAGPILEDSDQQRKSRERL